MPTLIDRLAGIDLGSRLDTVFAARTEARAQAELSYQLLLHPSEPGPVSQLEHHAVAAFVAAVHDQAETRDHYRALLLQRSDADAGHTAHIVLGEAENARAAGPCGHFPKKARCRSTIALGRSAGSAKSVAQNWVPGLAAALEQAHLLVLHPRDASPEGLQDLLNSGWSIGGIVTLSQLVAFLSFQIRVVSGLRAVTAAYSKTAVHA